jgi:hypothetical protein
MGKILNYEEFCQQKQGEEPAVVAEEVTVEEAVASTLGAVYKHTDALQELFKDLAEKEKMPAKELAAILQHIEAVYSMAKEVLEEEK